MLPPYMLKQVSEHSYGMELEMIPWLNDALPDVDQAFTVVLQIRHRLSQNKVDRKVRGLSR